MKDITRHTGVLKVIRRGQQSRMGNPRYIVSVDGIECKTQVDSSLGYSITNFNGEMVVADIGLHYGTLTIKKVQLCTKYPLTK